MPKQNLLRLILVFLPFLALGQEEVVATEKLPKRTSFIAEIGLGSFFKPQDEEQSPKEPSSNLSSFNGFPNTQVAFGVNAKLGVVQYEIKLGYAFSSYSYSGIQTGPVATFYTKSHNGQIQNHRMYIQPIGINFGQDHKWGSLVLGAFLRKNFSLTTVRNGTSERKWLGNVNVEVNDTKKIEDLIYFNGFVPGIQLGAEFNLKSENKLQLRTELVPYPTEFYGLLNTYSLTVSAAYIFRVRKREI